jgi:hypothetical protein
MLAANPIYYDSKLGKPEPQLLRTGPSPGHVGPQFRPPVAVGNTSAPAPVYRSQPGTSVTISGPPQGSLSAAPAPVYRPQASAGSAAPVQPGGHQSGGAPPPVVRPSQPFSGSQQAQVATATGQPAAAAAPPPVYRPQPQSAANGTAGGIGAPPPTYAPQAGSGLVPAPVYRPQQPAQSAAAGAPAPVYRPQPVAAALPPRYEPPPKKRAADGQLQVATHTCPCTRRHICLFAHLIW